MDRIRTTTLSHCVEMDRSLGRLVDLTLTLGAFAMLGVACDRSAIWLPVVFGNWFRGAVGL